MAEQSPLHETVERRLLADYHVALLRDDASLVLMDSKTMQQVTLDYAAAAELLDFLYNHRDLLLKAEQHKQA